MTITQTTYAEATDALTAANAQGDQGDFLGELDHLRAAATALEIATRTAVITARANGASWADVGHALGLTRQGAQQRYGNH